MKIAIWHNLPSGGGKRALYLHVKGLASRGHELEIWQPDTADADFLPLTPFAAKVHTLPLAKRVRRITEHHPRRKFLQVRAMKEHCRECGRQISRARPDVVFVNSCRFLYTSFLGQFVDLPSALYLGEPFRRLYEAMPSLVWAAPPARRFAFAWLSPLYLLRRIQDAILVHNYRFQVREEYHAARSYHRILVNSLYSRETIVRIYNLDAKVCYLGIDTDLFAPPDTNKEHYVAGLGSIGFGKGIDRAIDAMAALPAPRPPLVWVANAVNQNFLNQVTKQAAAKEVDFQLHVNVPDKRLSTLLAKAAVMLYTPRLEPFGLAPLEANACGTGVVAVAEGGVRESIADGVNGYLAPSAAPEMLAPLIEKFTSDLAFATRFGRQAQEYVKTTWNMDKAITNLENHLEELRRSPSFFARPATAV